MSNLVASIIKDTFENKFCKDQFVKFIKGLFNYIEEDTFVYKGNYIWDAFADQVTLVERIGKYKDSKENKIDVLVVTLKDRHSLEKSRTLQRNFVAKYLNGGRGGELRDAALVAFVAPDSEDWRFSLVKMYYQEGKTPSGKFKIDVVFTPAKRYSFLVGPNENTHTAQSRFIKILADDKNNPTLDDLENAFSVEVVSKEFFEKYRDLFVKTKEYLDKCVSDDSVIKEEFKNKDINTVDFTKKLLGQIVFLYFLQKKGWLGVPKFGKWGEGPRNFLRDLFDRKYVDYKNFFNDVLEPLFYEALRIDRSHDDNYYTHFDCKIPFLNGGLFDPVGNYDWVRIDISLPDSLFSNKERTKEGDTGTGILDVFDRYNFTVSEEEPLEKEVAIDPELLGKAYESFNAIRPDNYDEFVDSIGKGSNQEHKFNKQFGVFYTPREIVYYMCKESLCAYLKSDIVSELAKDGLADSDEKLKEIEKGIEDLVYSGDLVSTNDAYVSKINKETDTYRYQLSEVIRENASLIDRKLEMIKVCDPAVGSGAFLVGMMTEIVRIRSVLNTYLDTKRSIYELKRWCIENSLYGVDIDPGAVEITSLRLWLSLVVDEDDIKSIKPLPNLDYKIMSGNSLLNVNRGLFNESLLQKIEGFKKLYLNETNPSKKLEYKKEIEELRFELSGDGGNFDFRLYFSEVFSLKDGFDIVIGNPPYVQLQKSFGGTNKYGDIYKDAGFEVFDRTGDIYCLFYEKGIKLLKPNGILAYITSNKWMRAGYGESLRSFFLKYNPLLLIDLGPGVFESATVDTNILFIQKAGNKNQLKAVNLQKEDRERIEKVVKENSTTLFKLGRDAWFIGSDVEQKLKEKIESIGKPLKEWDVKIYRGVLTGLNEAFIITTEKRNEILANCKDKEERKRTEEIIKPILRGRDIKRYYYEWAGLWVIGTFPALRLNIDDYPSLKKYFLDNFDIRQLEQSGKKYPDLGFDARKKTGNKWFETQDQIAYYPEFEKEKVVYPNMASELQAVLDKNKFICNQKAFIITGSHLRYIASLFNSKVEFWYFKKIGATLGSAGYEMSKIFIEKLPLPPITPSNEHIVKQIENLVDKILDAKKQNPQADTSYWEREIDELVFELYGLTEEERKVIKDKIL